jgi:hypothetical protein
MKLIRLPLIILSALFSFSANATLIQEAQNFLIEVGDYQGFWFYSVGKPYSQKQEEALLKEYQTQEGEDLCATLENKRALFKKINLQIKFSDHYVLLLLTERKGSPREQDIHHFANQYQLPLMVVDKNQGTLTIDGSAKPISLQNVLSRLNANFQEVFLINPKKRQILLLSRSYHPCRLEQDFFFKLYENLAEHRSTK